MKRMHLFEFMDFRWYPNLLRNLQTNVIQVIVTRSPAFDSAVPYIDRVLQRVQTNQIVDLCSGASGPWLRIYKKLGMSDVHVLLTDKYPNVEMFADLQGRSGGRIVGIAEPVDALNVPPEVSGIRTMFTAFHHFRELEVETLLDDAQAKGQALCVFDYVPNKLLTLALSPLTFVISILQFYFLSFAVRPISWMQLLFTNIIPIVPLVAAWDGFVSAMRKYDADSLRLMVEGRSTDRYRWEVGTDNSYSRATPMTYLIGMPVESEP